MIENIWGKRGRDISISTKIALLAGVISVVSAIAIGAMFYQAMTGMITKNAEWQLKNQANISIVGLLTEINSLREDIVFFAKYTTNRRITASI